MKKQFTKLGLQLTAIFVMGILGAIFSLIFAKIGGQVGVAVAPEFHYRLLESWICPNDVSQAVPKLASLDLISPADKSPRCVNSDGRLSPGLQVQAQKSITNLYFLLCFIPTFIPGIILMWRLTGKIILVSQDEEV